MKLDEIDLSDNTAGAKAEKNRAIAGYKHYLTILIELEKQFEKLDDIYEADKIIPKEDREVIRNVQRYLSPIPLPLLSKYIDDKTGKVDWGSFQKKYMKGSMK